MQEYRGRSEKHNAETKDRCNYKEGRGRARSGRERGKGFGPAVRAEWKERRLLSPETYSTKEGEGG